MTGQKHKPGDVYEDAEGTVHIVLAALDFVDVPEPITCANCPLDADADCDPAACGIETSDDDDEPAPTPDCPACGGPTYLLGCLGKFANYRCRDCGTDCRDLACDLCGEPLTPAQYEAGEVDYAAGRTFHHGCQLDEAEHAAEQKAEIDAENAWLREAEGLNRLPDADDEHERELEANDPFLQFLEQGRHEAIAASGGGYDPLTGEYIPAK